MLLKWVKKTAIRNTANSTIYTINSTTIFGMQPGIIDVRDKWSEWHCTAGSTLLITKHIIKVGSKS